MNSKKIKAHASKLLLQGDAPLFVGGFIEGAAWANEQNATEIARLEAEKAELLDWLKEAIIQLNYMQQKFGETGSGNAVISRISALLETYGKK